jgi:hypothetical protein
MLRHEELSTKPTAEQGKEIPDTLLIETTDFIYDEKPRLEGEQ